MYKVKQILEKQRTFDFTLRALASLSKWKISYKLIPTMTSILAKINLSLNKPAKTDKVRALAESWKMVMPYDGQENFKIAEVTSDTAYVEIHLHCPLRGTGKVQTCHSFMNYDRTLMQHMGGSLTVLESQSNSGKTYCRLAIRRLADKTDDLIPAHLKDNSALPHPS